VTGPRAHQFRKHSLRVIEDSDLAPPFARLRFLLVLFVVTGIFFLCWQLVVAAVTRSEGPYALRIGLIVMLFYGCFSIAAGASYWTHYLQQLVPARVGCRSCLPAHLPMARWPRSRHVRGTGVDGGSDAGDRLRPDGTWCQCGGQGAGGLPAHRFGPRGLDHARVRGPRT
jgi:hypothetical protein